MKKILLAALLPCLAASALAEELSIDSKKEVAYTCASDAGSLPLTAMYGIKNGKIVAVQLKAAGYLSDGLFPAAGQDNHFVGRDAAQTLWTTERADAKTIDKVNGGVVSVVLRSGKRGLLFDNCKLDKAATAALNRP